jgi:sugar phosphate isomerase/epimerase
MSGLFNQISRREFLARGTQTAAGLLAAAGMTSCQSIKNLVFHPPGSKMRFGLVTYLWAKDWDLPTLIANCQKTKILGVELRTEHAHGVEAHLNNQQRQEVKKRFDDSPVTLVGLGTNFDFHHVDQNKLQKSIEEAKKYIQLSHDVGGSGIKVKPNALPGEVPVEKTVAQIGNALNELGRFGADLGQRIRLEVHGAKTQQLPVTKQIMDVAVHPNVGVCWNCNSQDLDDKGLEYNFNLVKDRFGDTVHVRELDSQDYPYQQLINMFVKMDYQGWILLEARTNPKDRIQALAEQAALFEKMRAQAQANM